MTTATYSATSYRHIPSFGIVQKPSFTFQNSIDVVGDPNKLLRNTFC